MTNTFFLDSYALIEIALGNANYKKYHDCGVITTKLNLMELYYRLLKTGNTSNAKKYFDIFNKYCIDITDNTLIAACTLKLKNTNLSYVDCIGYILAKKSKAKFLTGDREFKGLPDVEFVK